jgi:hypothetical protein
MNSRYITCYRRKGDAITVYLSDGHKIEGTITQRYIRFPYYGNDFLFDHFGIDKWELTKKLPYNYTRGNWPECRDKKGIIALLNALIKESKIRYYEATEL